MQTQAEFAKSYEFFTQTHIMLLLLFAAVVVGMLVGILSSLMAMNKHLKLKHW